MRIVNIAEAKTRVGEQLSAVHGTIKSVFKRRTGEGQYGPYSFQDVIIKDDTGEMSCTFASYDEMTPHKGSKVTISAKQGDKGLSGLMVKDESYTDKKTGEVKEVIKLYVTGSAFVDYGTTPVMEDKVMTGTPIPPDADDEDKALLEALAKKIAEKKAARLAAEAQSKAKVESEDKTPPVNGMSYAAVKRRIIQTSNLYSYALRSAKWALAKHDLEIKDLTTSAATLFIAFREDKLVDAMPMNLIDFDTPESEEPQQEEISEPEVDQEPKTWQEVRYNGVELGSMPAGEIEMLFNTFKPKINPKTGTYDMSDLYLVNSLKAWKKEQV